MNESERATRTSASQSVRTRRRSGLAAALVVVSVVLVAVRGLGEDCNRNGVDDARDIARTVLEPYVRSRVRMTLPGYAWWYVAGDVNGDGWMDALVRKAGNSHPLLLTGDALGRLELSGEVLAHASSFAGTLADLDTDGDLDLAIATRSELAVFWNDGRGNFAAGPFAPMPAVHRALVAGDVDGDGDVDLVAASWDYGGTVPDTVSYVECLGEGNYAPARNWASGNGAPRLRLRDADLDGDLDLLVRRGEEGSDFVIENFGGGRLAARAEPIRLGEFYRYVDTADFDGDGRPEILASISGRAYVHVKLSHDGFPVGPVFLFERTPDMVDIVVHDVTGDGLADIVALSRGCPSMRLWAGDPSSGFVAQGVLTQGLWFSNVPKVRPGLGTRNWLVGVETSPTHVVGFRHVPASHDCDASGVPDECEVDCNSNRIADVCDVSSGVSSDCNGNLVPDECDPDCDLNGVPDDCEVESGAAADCNGNGRPDVCELAAGDANGNGVLDACEHGLGPEVDCNPNAFDSPEAPPGQRLLEEVYAMWGGPVELSLGDVDGDADLDMIVADTWGRGVSLYVHTRCGSFGRARPIISEPRLRYYAVELVDVDSDGDLDLLVAHDELRCGRQSGSIRVLANRGGGDFATIGSYALPGVPEVLATADLNGDGAEDIVVNAKIARDTRLSYALVGRGDGTFEPPHEVDRNPRALALGDIDGDGDIDIATANWIRLNDGAGRFSDPLVLPRTGSSVVAGDLDGDGDADLVIDSFVVLGAPDARLMPGAPLPESCSLHGAFLVDLDRDGDLDILGYPAAWEEPVVVLVNAGDATFGAGDRFRSARNVLPLAAGDLEPDRDVDVIGVSFDFTALVVMRWSDDDAPDGPREASLDGHPSFAACANDIDRDGDGRSDLCDLPLFRRGDVDRDGATTVTDVTGLLAALFLRRAPLGCADAADADDDGAVAIGDAVALLRRLFHGAGPLPAPADACGIDASPDALDCASYPPCG